MFYAISYTLMGTAAFGVILALARSGFECENVDDLKGLNRRSPWMAFLMMLVMFSLAGVPPLFGFFAKLLVLQAAIHAGMMWLAIEVYRHREGKAALRTTRRLFAFSSLRARSKVRKRARGS